MKPYAQSVFATVFAIAVSVSTFAQANDKPVSIGVRFHHISNGDQSGSNRGLNQFVIYAGFSVFK